MSILEFGQKCIRYLLSVGRIYLSVVSGRRENYSEPTDITWLLTSWRTFRMAATFPLAASSLWASLSGSDGADATSLALLANQAAAQMGKAGYEASASDCQQVFRWVMCAWDTAAVSSGATVRSAADILISKKSFGDWYVRFGSGGLVPAFECSKSVFVSSVRGGLTLQPWYHGLTVPSATAAAGLLRGKPAGSFLLRVSLSEAGCFTASYVTAGGDIKHTRIQHLSDSSGYLVVGASKPEPTLLTVVAKFASILVFPVPSSLSELSARTVGMSSGMAEAVPTVSSSPSGGAGASTSTSTSVPVLVPAPAAGAGDEEFDVMLSYQWDEQVTVRRLRHELQAAGFHVWMDETHMSATYVTDMVNAVNGAKCIMICATSKYLLSKNCATEANLAFEFRDKKSVLILNMEPGFYPASARHVVGALAAGRLYCDFTTAKVSEEGFQRGLTDVFRQLASFRILPRHAATTPALAATTAHTAAVARSVSGNNIAAVTLAAPLPLSLVVGGNSSDSAGSNPSTQVAGCGVGEGAAESGTYTAASAHEPAGAYGAVDEPDSGAYAAYGDMS